MTSDWRNDLDHDGAAVIERLVGDDVTALALSAAQDGGEASSSQRGGGFGRRNLLDAPDVAAVADDPAIRRVVQAVLGPDARPVRGLFFDKTPQANWTVPWHQDRSVAVREKVDDAVGYGPWSVKRGVVHVQPPVGVLRDMLTIRLHLDDCGPDNGPLRIVPATHGELLDAAGVESVVERGPRVALTCGVGGAVVMRPLVLHASSPARSPRHRRVLHLEYAAGDLPGGVRWHVG